MTGNATVLTKVLAERIENVRRYLKAVFLSSYLKFAQIEGKEGCFDHQRLHRMARDKMIVMKTKNVADATM